MREFPFWEVAGFPGDSVVKNLRAMQEKQKMRVLSLGREDPLEEGMATHSSVFAGKIPWIEEIGLLQQSDFPNSGNKSVSSARHIVRAKDVLCNE